MRRLLRILGFAGLGIVALLAAILLYLAFGDLGRHKGRIESFVTQRLGRPFAIDGRFALDLFPAVKVEAEQVRIGNVPWGSTAQMVQVGRFATEIDLWSLVSGPVNVRSLELRDVTIALERDEKGRKNWVIGEPQAEAAASDATGAFTKLPIAFQHATLSGLRLSYHAPGAPDRTATIEKLDLTPDPQGMLGLDGGGTFDGYKAQLAGRIGPIKSLLSGRDIHLDLAGGFGNLRFAAKGGFGGLNPLDGADLSVSVENPDLGMLLHNLRLPAIATGRLDIKFVLKDAGERTDLDLAARAGDLALHTTGKITVLGRRNSDLTFTARAADAARLASVFDIRNVPAGELALSGHLISTPKALKVEAFHATLAGYETSIDASIPARRGGAARLRFDLTAPNLADLKPNLPALPLKASGEVAYRTGTQGRPGSLESLRSARNVQLDVGGDLGKTHFTAQGGIGRLDPLDGADVKVSIGNPDVGTLLQGLRMPAIASGPLQVNATLKHAGKLTDLDLTAQASDLSLHTTGKIAVLGLRGSDLVITARAGDASRLATLFNIKGVPATALAANGHLVTTPDEFRFDSVHAKLGDIEARFDGALPRQRDRLTQLHFNMTATSLRDLKATLPSLPLQISGDLAHRPDEFRLTKLVALVGESRMQGTVTLRTQDRQVIADISSPLLDLTPFLPKKSAAQTASKEKKRFLFGEQPLPFPQPGNAHVNVHLVAAEIRFAQGVLHQVDATLALDDGHLRSRVKAHGGFGGSMDGSIDLAPMGDQSASVQLDLSLQNVRSGFASGEAVPPEETPPLDLKLSLASTGATPHQLAAAATGSILVSQGPGKTRSNLLDRIGSDIIAQLLSKLNPFTKQDPYTQVDCMVARVDIKDGKTTVAPVLMQTRKVAITASGTVDLKTEKLLLNFNTRPRQGIGISPGMFTNPFLDLTGTLTSPSIGVGGKGMASGAVAAATGGLSVLAKGVVDRAIGETNQCKEVLEKAQHPTGGHAP